MAQQVFEVQALTGQARNPVHGQATHDLLPQRVFNLVPDRAGGYAPFGWRGRVSGVAGDTTLPVEGLVGADELGISSYRELTNRLAVYRGGTVHKQHASLPAHDASALKARLAHLELAGAYLDRGSFLVARGQPNTPAMQPVASRVAVAVEGGEPLRTTDMGWAGGVVEVAYGNGTFIGIGPRHIYRRTSQGEWEEAYAETNAGRGDFVRVAYGGGRWLVAQQRGGANGAPPTTPARLFASSDDGASWLPPFAFPLSFEVRALVHLRGSEWVAGGRRASVVGGAGSAATHYSANGGASWDGGHAHGRGFIDTGVAGDGQAFLPQNVTTLHEDPLVSRDDIGLGRAWWVWWTHLFPVAASKGNEYRLTPLAYRAVAAGDGWAVVLHRTGQVSRTQWATPKGGGAAGVIHRFAGVAESGGTVNVRAAAYDATGGVVLACGSFTPTGGSAQPRAWRSTDNGQSWTRVTDVEVSYTGAIASVAVDDLGHAVYAGADGREVFTGARAGLDGGAYRVTVVSYFNTPAGRFVYDVSHTDATSEDGGVVTFTASSRAMIVDDTPWLADPGLSESQRDAVLDDLRFDVYIQKASATIAGEEVRYTLRYAFTERFPGARKGAPGDILPVSMEEIGRSIEALPLGRQLLTDGTPTTVVFQGGAPTAVHSGRVWGIANQDEGAWPQGDGISLEVANQSSRFVLCYTEIGWANLMSDRSFIPIQPTQSSRLTGLVSTPSGLLVLFDNEIFLVTGDPAFGNVSVELYLDLVGHDGPRWGGDPGPRPAKVGGVPFVIWNGKVWALQAGQAQQLGAEQWLREDPFVRVAAEPQSRSLLALTASGQVFRYLLDDQYWFTDPATRVVNATTVPATSTNRDQQVVELLPNCVCASGDNTRFVLGNGEVHATRQVTYPAQFQELNAPDTPHLLYRDVDFGAAGRRSSLYQLSVGVEGGLALADYDRKSATYDASALPALFYEASNAANVTPDGWRQPAPLGTGGIEPVRLKSGGRAGNVLRWRLPLRRTRGTGIDLRLELRGLGFRDALKLPLRFFFASGGEPR